GSPPPPEGGVWLPLAASDARRGGRRRRSPRPCAPPSPEPGPCLPPCALLLAAAAAAEEEPGARQPWFYGWGFNLPRGQALLEKWNLIPEGVDILITHGPPLGFLDWVPKKMQRVGCVELLNTVQRRVQPRLHVFGHIHEGYGVMADGTTTYVNASVCTVNYQPVNPPIVIDLPTPRNS
uniref:Metallophosphoesterase domain containing 1 n=1 Tax=Felis catus TaxID=9685 RepID=A0ABI7ZVU6_FELCA